MSNKKIFEISLDVLLVLLGTAIYGFGLYYFIEPINVAPGGVAGISIILNYLFNLPVGLMNTLINIPLLLIGWKYMGREFIWKTLLSLGSFNIFYDYVFSFVNPYAGDKILACLFGGVLVGAGLGIVFARAGSTGGMDIVNKLVNKKYRHIPIGKIMLFTDFVVILISVFAFGAIESALYAVIVIYLSSQLMDMVIYGFDKGKLIYVFSDFHQEIAENIIKNIQRGVTYLDGEGAYTGQKKRILICAVRNNEWYRVKKIVYEIDPTAFIIVSDTAEVSGEGFKPIDIEE